MHRVILDCPSNLEVDHKNHNGLDNRRSNIRVVTRSQNQHNKTINSKKVTGVYFDEKTGKWRASIGLNGKRFHIGYFTLKKDAINANKNILKRLDLFRDKG